MKKKFAILLLAVMIFGMLLSGCDGKNKDEEKQPDWYVTQKEELINKANEYMKQVDDDYSKFNSMLENEAFKSVENLQEAKQSTNELYEHCKTILGMPESLFDVVDSADDFNEDVAKSIISNSKEIINSTWEGWDKAFTSIRPFYDKLIQE